MVKTLLKSAMVVALSLLAMTSVYANWQCKVHNARGQVWYGAAPTRSGASANAMGFCASGSAYARNCVLDWCQINGPVVGNWQCNATNARGQLWIGRAGTRSAAAANAMGFCAAHSQYARNCQIQTCFMQ